MSAETKWTAVCTSCGHVYQQANEPDTCTECGFSGLVTLPPGTTLPPEVRRELDAR